MKTSVKNPVKPKSNNFPGYPYYPESEDIYSNEVEVKDFEPDDISKFIREVEEHDNSELNLISKYNEIVSRE